MQKFITGGLVVTANGDAPIPGGVVALEGDDIAAVGTAEEFGVQLDGAETIDATGCTVLPGLIDDHVHVFMYPEEAGFTETEATVWATNYLQTALRGGVTTVRDLACRWNAIFDLKKAVNDQWIVGPRILAAGKGITMTGGHGYRSGTVEADGPAAVTRAARQQLKNGADVIKLMATGGVGTPGGELPQHTQLSLEEMRAGVEAAHNAGKPATAHAHATLGIRNALQAGVDCIEHGIYLDDETIEWMLEHDVALSPTLSVYRRIIQAGEKGLVPAFRVPKARAVVEPHATSFRAALEAGVRISLGTDAVALHHPLGDVAYELELWVDNGMLPAAAIEAATRVTAEVCQIDQEVGTLEPNKRADILIVEGDVLADIRALYQVRRVLRDGRVLHDALAESGQMLLQVADSIPAFAK